MSKALSATRPRSAPAKAMPASPKPISAIPAAASDMAAGLAARRREPQIGSRSALFDSPYCALFDHRAEQLEELALGRRRTPVGTNSEADRAQRLLDRIADRGQRAGGEIVADLDRRQEGQEVALHQQGADRHHRAADD